MKYFAFLMFVFCSRVCFGQAGFWEKLPAPTGCSIFDFAADSSGNIYALSNSDHFYNLYRSSNDAESWELIADTINFDFFNSVDKGDFNIDKNGVFYLNSAFIGRFQKSVDNGTTWTDLPVQVNGKTYYLYGLVFGNDNSIIVTGANIFDNDIYILKSYDLGNSWIEIGSYSNTSRLDAKLEKANNGVVWFASLNVDSGTEIWKSTNNGDSFELVSDYPLWTFPINLDFEFIDKTIFFSNSYGIFKTTNEGLTWDDVAPINSTISRLFASSDGVLFANDTYSLYKSFDLGLTWNLIDYPYFGTNYMEVFFRTPLGSILGGAQNDEKNGITYIDYFDIWKSSGSDFNWKFAAHGCHEPKIFSIEINQISGVIYVLTETGFYNSADNGLTWKKIGGINVFLIAASIQIDKSGNVYLFNGSQIFKSDNDFNTFSIVNYPITQIRTMTVSNLGKIFILEYGGLLLASEDGGFTWQQVNTISQSSFFFKIKAITENLLVVFATPNEWFKSLDGGITWSPLNWGFTPMGFDQFNSIYSTDWGAIFAIDDQGFLQKSMNLGASWEKITVQNFILNEEFISTQSGQIFVSSSTESKLGYSDDFGSTWSSLDYLEHGDLRELAFNKKSKLLFASARNYPMLKTAKFDFNIAKITGQIQKDQNQNCQSDTTDLPLQNWLIQATDSLNHKSYATTDQNGNYRLGFIIPDSATTNLTLEIQPPNTLWQPCDSTKIVTVSPQDDTATGIDFPVDAVVDCPLLDVSASFWPARPCFSTTVGVNWCNLGTLPALDARLFVLLDPLILVDSTSLPIAAQNGDTLEFLLGDVGLNACGNVRIFGYLSCDAVVGQAICVSTNVTPDSICAAFPTWSGATLHASANCVGDSIIDFSIENIGIAPSTADLDYVVIEDQVLLFSGQVPSLAPGQQITVPQAANGSTFRLQGEQEPNHPVSQFIAAWSEGCGENAVGQQSFGWITPFLGEDGDPFSDEFCRQVTASYDPNSKEALPVGYGSEHFINPNQTIEYLVNFQNTGNDTAFQVVLRDTISQLMNLATLRVGAASHDFSYEIYGNGILKFIFQKINLPDSTTNEAASHGWVSFQIDHRKNLPLGTVIKNHAGIYFDFNAPILTNETWHTLGENFVLLDWKTPPENPKIGVKISPNPMTESVIFDLQNIDNQTITLELVTPEGRLARRQIFSEKPFLMKRNGLPSGVYLFKISNQKGDKIGDGKLLIR
jgi:uncharacterized repeat protein (TIGR01451 family)